MRTEKKANTAPATLARTSVTSACLVVVNNSCNISMTIPNTNENNIEINKDIKLYLNFNCLLKNKNHTNVNTK